MRPWAWLGAALKPLLGPRQLPLLALCLLPCLLFFGAIPGPAVVSADDHLTVHHAYQQAAGGRVRHPHLSDPAMQFAALRERVVDALAQGQVPLWNPDLYAGAPLLGDGQSMVGSPVTWTRLFLPEDSAQDLGVWWVLVWTGLGTALLARRLGAAPWGVAVAGAAAMTGPFPMVWLLHPQAATFCWLPWLLWAIERRGVGLVALSTAGLLAGGHPGTAVHGLVLGLAWWGVRVRSGRVVLGVVLGGLLAAPLTLPLAEQVLRSTTAGARGGQPLLWPQLMDLLWPGWWGHPARETWQGPGSWADAQLHPGLATLALALLGLRWPLGRALLGAWGLCLGAALLDLPGPFSHGRLGAEGALFLAVGAGWVAGRQRWAPLALVAVVLSGAAARWDDQASLPAEQHDPVPAPWVENLRAALGCPACARVLGLSWALQPNTGARLGIPDLRGYDLPVSEDTHRLMSALSPRPQGPWYPVDALPALPLLRFAGVGVVLSETPLELPAIELGRAPIHAHRIPDPLPRAWLALSAIEVGDPETALGILATDPEAPRQPPVEGIGSFGQPAPIQPLSVEPDGDSWLRITVQSDQPGLVVIRDAWAPGWRAAVDGVPAHCLRVGGAFRGVWVPANSQEVVLRYRPLGWIWGLRLGFVGLVGLLGWVGYRARTR